MRPIPLNVMTLYADLVRSPWECVDYPRPR